MSVATNSGFVSDAWLPRRRTLVLVGHLPHAGGTWLSQFADREAVDFGPVCLLRPSEEGTQISVYRAKRGALTLGSYPSIEVALNEIAASVARWMVVARTTATIEIPEGTDDIVVLTAVHQSAVYHAESIVMRCLDVLSSRPAPRPGLSVVVLGATAEEHALVAARISDSIGPPNAALIDVRRSVQRVGPVQHLEGEAAGTVATLARLFKCFDEVESGPLSPPNSASLSKADPMPEPMPEPMPVFFRLYYNEDGAPIHYTMEDLPGTYIDIDAKTYATASLNVRVQDGKLIQLANKIITKKLVPSATGTPCHPDNVAIVVSESQPHQRWKLKTYETD